MLTGPITFEALDNGCIEMRALAGRREIRLAMSPAQAMQTGRAGRAFMERWAVDHRSQVDPIGAGKRPKH